MKTIAFYLASFIQPDWSPSKGVKWVNFTYPPASNIQVDKREVFEDIFIGRNKHIGYLPE